MLTWIRHVCTCAPHPESAPPPQSHPSGSSRAPCIMHWTWTGDSFHIWWFTCFSDVSPYHPAFLNQMIFPPSSPQTNWAGFLRFLSLEVQVIATRWRWNPDCIIFRMMEHRIRRWDKINLRFVLKNSRTFDWSNIHFNRPDVLHLWNFTVSLHMEGLPRCLSISACAQVLSCVWLCHSVDYSPPGSSVHGIPPARKLECYIFLQGIFPTQGSNPCLSCLLR